MSCIIMIKLRALVTAAIALLFAPPTPAPAQDYGGHILRFGNTSSWYYDGRNDDRDFSTNGFFPGDFAAHPANAVIGAAGLFGGSPWRSATPYPSQVILGSPRDRIDCSDRDRPYYWGSARCSEWTARHRR